MATDIVFVRTRSGALALADQSVPLSTGFRRLLRLVDGKRNTKALAEAMSHIDVEDLALWTTELLRQGLIARAGEVPVEEMAFGLTMEMPSAVARDVLPDPAADAMIGDILADLTQSAGPAPDPTVTQRLLTTGRMAAIESVAAHKELESAGYYVDAGLATAVPAQGRALIVGHLPAQNRILELLFRRFGLVVSLAADRDAMRAALALPDKPHVLIVDAELPRLDAFRTLEALQIDPVYQDMRVVFLSERRAQADLARAMMLGASAYLVKPLKKDILDAALPLIVGAGK